MSSSVLAGEVWGALAVAASVTVAVLAGVRLYNQNEVAGPQLAQQAPQPTISVPQANQGPTVLAGYSEQAELPAQTAESAPVERWHEERLPSYVRQHAQQAALAPDRRARCRTLVRPAWKNVREKHARITAVCGDGGWLSMPASLLMLSLGWGASR